MSPLKSDHEPPDNRCPRCRSWPVAKVVPAGAWNSIDPDGVEKAERGVKDADTGVVAARSRVALPLSPTMRSGWVGAAIWTETSAWPL